MTGKSNVSLTIRYPNARIRFGSKEDRLTDELDRHDAERVKAAQSHSIAYIFPCAHEEKVYDVIDDRYHVHACKYCQFQERAQNHSFNANGVCTVCYYNRGGTADKYPIWFLGTQLTSDTRTGNGYRYDPAANTLTLTQNIQVNGKAQLKNGAGIYAEGDLSIAGPGNGGSAGIMAKNTGDYGILVKGGTLTIRENSALEFTGTQYGIYAPDGLKVEKVSHLVAEANSGSAVFWGSKALDMQEDLAFRVPAISIPGTSGVIEMLKKNQADSRRVELIPGVSLSFDANGGLGTMKPVKGLISGREYTFPKLAFTWQHYEFVGWDLNNRGYLDGSKFTVDSDRTAIAQWKAHIHDYHFKNWEWEGVTRAKASFVCSTCGNISEMYAGIAREITKAATCTEPGIRTYTAIIYRDLRYTNSKEVSIPALDHDWGPGIVTKEATTEAPGVRTYTCRRDSSHVWTEPIPQLHKHDLRKVESVSPTCVKEGNIEHWRCRGCGSCFSDSEGKNRIYIDTIYLPATGKHISSESWSKSVEKEATCTEQGSVAYRFSCKVCNRPMEPRYSTTDPLGHDWSEWLTTRAATDSEAGVQTRTCGRCKEVQTRSIAKLETHTPVKVAKTEPDCTRPGSIEYYRCSGCGAFFSDAEGKFQLQEKDIVIPAKGHQYGAPIERTSKEPTCTETGVKHSELRCTVCNELFDAGELPIPALGHSWGEWTVTRPAAETEEGVETRVCTRDSSHTETRPIPKTAHVHALLKTEATAASCTAAGNIAYWICAGCGKLFSDARGENELGQQSVSVPAKGHTPGGWTERVITKPGCTDQGLRHLTQHCTVCGAELNTHDELIPALGHSWGEWLTVRPATEAEEGAETRTCHYDASHTETRAVAKLQHRHTLTAIPEKAASCTEAGSIACWRCSGCGLYFSDAAGTKQIDREQTVLAPSGHSEKGT